MELVAINTLALWSDYAFPRNLTTRPGFATDSYEYKA
jgi:hypothetical protein